MYKINSSLSLVQHTKNTLKSKENSLKEINGFYHIGGCYEGYYEIFVAMKNEDCFYWSGITTTLKQNMPTPLEVRIIFWILLAP